MRVHVKFFAIFREFTKIKSEWREIAEGTSVELLWKEYAAVHPRIANLRAAYAVNQHLAKSDHVLSDGDEVAFLPPVSGGAGKKPRRTQTLAPPARAGGAQRKRKKISVTSRKRSPHIRSKKSVGVEQRTLATMRSMANDAFITRKPIDLNALYRRVAFPGAGAILTFSGVVRDNAQGKSVDHLEYEVYPEMAEQTMRDIIEEMKQRFPEARVAMAHRIGRLKIGDASLIIAVAAPHRPEAYAASRYAIERVKAILPVWKKEFATDGEYWVEGPVAGELSVEKADAIVRRAEEDAAAR